MSNITEIIVTEAAKIKSPDPEKINAIKRAVLRSSKISERFVPTAAELIKSYHKLVKENKLKPNPILMRALAKRAVRSLSGVAVITVLTKPYPCPGKCVYCPHDPTMPESYLADEPAAARALALHFDPYVQVRSRIDTLVNNGHPAEKLEVIVKGGTWGAYPLSYQYWFTLRLFDAANLTKGKGLGPDAPLTKLKAALRIAQKQNEKATGRIIGYTLETRPDWITAESAEVMRDLGATRIEMGVQTTDDKILKIVNRGHDTETSKRATSILRRYGFKVDYHLMPMLPTSTPAKDSKMLAEIFSDPSYRPDMVKIYPCTVIAGSELYNMWKRGEHKPYSAKQLLEVLIKFKTIVPRYVRISRLIRDIPGNHVVAGNMTTNLRQDIQTEMKRRGLICSCLRCREIGHLSDKEKLDLTTIKPKLFVEEYRASGGMEYFLSFENPARTAVFAFCRLRVDPTGIYPSFIRELHTYGQALPLGVTGKKSEQHQGLGKQLIISAEKIAKKKGANKLAVISGVGVRPYYRASGYRLENGYMVKWLKK